MSRVMCVGIATLDIINRVEHYPAEDSEVRALAQSQRLGGNAANTATVLAQLGVQAFWVGNPAQPAEIIEHGFARHGVDISLAVRIPDAVMPTSYILLSRANGSRSIVHFRDLPEYSAEDFLELDLRSFDWVHFEVARSISWSRCYGVREACADRRFRWRWRSRGTGSRHCSNRRTCCCSRVIMHRPWGLRMQRRFCAASPQGVLATRTWGAQGAWAIDHDGGLLHAAASVHEPVIDTIGAGDVFNAAMVHALSTG